MIYASPPPLHFPRPAIIKPAEPKLLRATTAGLANFLPGMVGAAGFVKATGPTNLIVTRTNVLTDLTNVASGASYTFSDVSGLGTHTHVFVLVTVRSTAGSISTSTVTVEGVSATQIVSLLNGSQLAEIWAVAQATTTPDIVITNGGPTTATNIAVAVIGAKNVTSLTAIDTASSNADPAPLSVDVVADGIVMACGVAGVTSVTWTGVTQLYQTTLEASFLHSGGYFETTGNESPRTVTGDYSASNFNASVSASFR